MVVYCLDEGVARQVDAFGQRLVDDINEKARDTLLVVKIEPVAVEGPVLLLARVLNYVRARLDDLSCRPYLKRASS